ncbi:MAG TPA: DMT family transporter [Caulobacteraceae bacterium]|nr:DMT family transporter [Caulobacteraceae bacterium]
MTPVQIAAVMMVGSGAIHAVVNAILKSGKDKMASRALIDGFSAILMAPAAFFLPLPHGAWGWLAASGVTHLVYLICLVKAFETADYSVAYPIMRGIAPVLAAAVSVAGFHEPLAWSTAGGIALVSLGVITMGLGKHADRKTLLWAAGTGVTIAFYTVIDAHGVRAAPNAASYICWVFIALGFGIASLFALWRGPVFVVAARTEWKAGFVAGALSIVTYGLALWALRLGDTPRLAALRETSILFAALIAVAFLKERFTRGRVAAVACIAAGAVVLIASAR